MILLHKRKEIINRKELNRRIEIVKKAKYYLETEGLIMWAGEYLHTEQELFDKATECIGRKYAKRIFK